MSIEIERKFLVHADRISALDLSSGVRFTQGYLSTKPAVRVRLAESLVAPSKAWLTVKGPAGSGSGSAPGQAPSLRTRSEFEYEIPATDAAELLALSVATLTKIRRLIRVDSECDGKIDYWEVDQFLGPHEGLWLAEIELDSEDEAFERPTWLAEEVTEDPRYSNGALALAGTRP